MAYEKQEDKRYQEFDLKFLSTEEMNMCLKLRQYGLDPIPFPIKIPAPVDCPTSERFEIDFLMPCDVLVNFGEQEILGDIDPETGERQVTYIVQPIIEHQIMFIGEYFKGNGTHPNQLGHQKISELIYQNEKFQKWYQSIMNGENLKKFL